MTALTALESPSSDVSHNTEGLDFDEAYPVVASRSPLPCHTVDPDLWFAEAPADVETAKALCVPCPLRELCLAGALERREPWGVWGGQLVLGGEVVARKRPRGRPRKDWAA
jgi:WhiB family redox-sensing transcriptional regulator